MKADPGQIEQVLMNLVVNARDAMPDGGQLTIETANVDVDEEYAAAHDGLYAGHYVMLGVYDTGDGIDAETKSRLFEPFFTTKEPGKGTGLGLATVYGIVKQSEGYILVESEPGKGAAFKVFLHRLEAGADEIEHVLHIVEERPRGSETVLLVEDEEVVRNLVREILEGNGYTVIEARNGAEALELGAPIQGPDPSARDRRRDAEDERSRARRAPRDDSSRDPHPLHVGLHGRRHRRTTECSTRKRSSSRSRSASTSWPRRCAR